MGEINNPFESDENVQVEGDTHQESDQEEQNAVPENWFTKHISIGRPITQGFFNPEDVVVRPKKQPQPPITFKPVTNRESGGH